MQKLIIRVKRKSNFTAINNDILRSKMSFEAKGFLCYVLSLPDDWQVHASKIMSEFSIGRSKFNSIINELESNGYSQRIGQENVGGGKFGTFKYLFFDEPSPLADLPQAVEPYAVEPHAAKQQLLNTNNNKELINSNNLLNKMYPLPLKTEIEKPDEKHQYSFDFNDFEEGIVRIYNHFGVLRTKNDFNKKQLKKYFDKWVNMGRDPRRPLNALQNILKDPWQKSHRFPNAQYSKLFNLENVARFEKKC